MQSPLTRSPVEDPYGRKQVLRKGVDKEASRDHCNSACLDKESTLEEDQEVRHERNDSSTMNGASMESKACSAGAVGPLQSARSVSHPRAHPPRHAAADRP